MDLNGAHSCEHCSQLILDLADGRFDSTSGSNRLVFNFNLHDIQQAHAQGCLLLSPIVSSWLTWNQSLFSQWEGQESDIVLFATVEYCFHGKEEDEHYDCDLTAIEGFCLWNKVSHKQVNMPFAGEFYVIASKDDAASAAIKSRPIAIDPASKETYAKLRENLEYCLRMEGVHSNCKDTPGNYVPSRLLELDTCAQGPPKIRICSPDEPTPYAVLSYCWGGDQAHKTTSTTLAAKYINIQWEFLPQSIRDAIQVTLNIGLKYLWVDSICIIQDDDTDKQKEIASMPRIYNESVVTIIAAKAKSAQEGFLHRLDTADYDDKIFKLGFRCEHGMSGYAFLIKEDQYRYSYGESDPIDSRAWTLQESYLSKRIIRYGSKQCSMFCQCSPSKPQIVDGWALTQSYDTPEISNIIFPEIKPNISPEDIAKWKQYFKKEYGTDPVEFKEETDEEDIYSSWRGLVMNYSTRSLTVPADRILAISGLADRIAPAMHSRYVAGHWENHLPKDLLWEISSGSLSMRPTTYQGPSWSWTSVNGSVVSYDYMPVEAATLKVLCVEIELCNSLAPFGAVKTGLLRAQGKLVKVRWNGTELLLLKGGKALPLARSHFIGSFLVPDTLDEDFIRVANHSQSPWDRLIAQHAGATGTANTKVPTSSECDMYLLEVYPSGATTSFDTRLGESKGLILKDVPTGRRGPPINTPRRLRRIGLFNFTDHSTRDSEVSVSDWDAYIANQRHCFDNYELEEIVIE
ncbi:heterokaryon incompatibility protein-domain-containing protein [Hypoxylon sp. FL1150]|nr:heterokaryon incompatibility protein-domain-containing protein [Hypoxylon sp. FL1150]